MIKILAVLLFILWLLGAFGMYAIGWSYHALLIASILLIFFAMMRTRKIELTEIMKNNELSETEAEQVKEIMDKHKLNEQEAFEVLKIRSKSYFVGDSNLLQTEAGQVKKVMNKNKLNQREAIGLLSIRMGLHQ